MIEETNQISIDEEKKYSIISHKIRRKIIQHIYLHGSISYSTLAKEWKIKTGPIYYHLNMLKPYLEHTENEVYFLNESGRELSQWLFHDHDIQVKVRKLDAHTALFSSLIHKIVFNPILVLFVYLLLMSSFYTESELNLIQVGPFITTNKGYIANSLILNAFNILGFVAVYALLVILERIMIGETNFFHSLHVYALSLLPLYFTNIGLYFLVRITMIQVSLAYWSIITIFNQIFFLSINSTGLVLRHPSKIERVFLVLIILLYLSLLLSVFVSG